MNDGKKVGGYNFECQTRIELLSVDPNQRLFYNSHHFGWIIMTCELVFRCNAKTNAFMFGVWDRISDLPGSVRLSADKQCYTKRLGSLYCRWEPEERKVCQYSGAPNAVTVKNFDYKNLTLKTPNISKAYSGYEILCSSVASWRVKETYAGACHGHSLVLTSQGQGPSATF